MQQDSSAQPVAPPGFPLELNDFRDIIHNAPIGIFTSTPDGRFISVNPALARMYGYLSPEEMIESVTDLAVQTYADPADRDLFVRLIQEQEEIIDHECLLRRKDGSCFWASRNARAIRDRAGTILFYQGFTTDISPRKEAELQLKASQERLQSIFRVAPTGIGVVCNRHFSEVNERICEMTGYDAEELLGRNARMLYPTQEDYDYVGSEKYRQIASRGTGMVETRWQRKDGAIINVLMASTPIEPKDLHKGVTFTALDITERKQAEEDLRHALQTFLTVLNGIEAAIYVADLTTHEILFANRHLIDTYGFDPTGRTCFAALRGEKKSCEACPALALLPGIGDPTTVRVREGKNPVTGKHLIYHDRLITWLDGRQVRLQVATDITPLKDLEQERNRIREQLRQSQKLESIGRLAGGVAHDFNNMLGVILGHVDMAMEDLPDGDPLLDSLQQINRAAERSAELTSQLLAFARKQMASPRLIDLNEIVSTTAGLLQRTIGENIKLVWRPGWHVHPVKLDPTQLEQILVNLCINARDAIGDRGQIVIETGNTRVDNISTCALNECLPGDYAILRVSDDGCGMDQDTMANLFEPFFTTKDVGKGTGLGLATVYGIVHQNNGFIQVESKAQQGSTFTIYLPRQHAEPEPSAGTPGRESGRTPDTILLVEDEPMNLTMVKLILERQGFHVIAALTPNEAIKRAQEHPGDIRLLLTDVVMPEMNGRDLAAHLLSRHPGIKILYMSGYTSDIIARHGVLEEGLHFIQKPFTSSALIARVKEMLNQDSAST